MKSLAGLVAPASRLRVSIPSLVFPPSVRSLSLLTKNNCTPWSNHLPSTPPLIKTFIPFSTASLCRFQTTVSHNSSLIPADPDLVPRTLAFGLDNDKVSCAHFDQNGDLTAQQKELTKDQIGQQFELRHRDLRDIDLKSEAVTRILVRPATILLQFFDLCVIVQANESLLIDMRKSDNRRAASFYKKFGRRLSGLEEAADVPELPYELRAVEAALIAILSDLRQDFMKAKDDAEQSGDQLKLENGIDAFDLDRLFEQSRLLEQIEQKARLVRDTIREVLDTDQDLAGMYLTDRLAGRPHDIADHQEAEYMLEAYHKVADGLVESSQGVISIIHKNESLFRASLAVQRNQIMFLEARIAIHTLGLAAGTLVAGLFGMNLVNYFEESPYGFAVVTGACVVLSSIFSAYGMRSIRRISTLKEISHTKLRRSDRRA